MLLTEALIIYHSQMRRGNNYVTVASVSVSVGFVLALTFE